MPPSRSGDIAGNIRVVGSCINKLGFRSENDFARIAVTSFLLRKAVKGTGTVRGLPVGNATAVAIAQCDEGDPGPAIPVLQQQLRDRGIAVPSRL